ncbi:LysR family transcriptional regulator [Catenulispora rubra]|uniref:LysR family transcriptional regulator n=1 Tax=Catenulispora rubra TaxID=280293 RepID=UPI00189212AA|nr:LysR family transcriptional regulator [Catenulispora rubra]
MSDLETRELEYFLAVADELHFGRAAVRLSIAQPALSKAIRRIEHRIGVPLFVRSSRHVELTPSGRALQEHGRHALNAVSAAVRHAQSAGGAQTHLRLVLKPGGDGGLLSDILAAYAEQPDARHVDILFSGPADRADFLLDGRADVGLLYAPFDPLKGLAHERLYTEDRVVIIAAGHRLAKRASVRMADLEGEKRPLWKGVPQDGSTGILLGVGGTGGADGTAGSTRKNGSTGTTASTASAGSGVTDVVQMLHMIAATGVVEVLPRSLVASLPSGVVCVPVRDAPPSHIVLAWNEQDRRPSVAAFVTAALKAAR